MNKYTAMFEYNLKRICSNKSNMVLCFAMPIGFYVLMSAMFSNYDASISTQFIQVMVPNFILIITSNALFNIFGVMYVETISTGNIEKYELLGIKKFTYSCMLLLATVVLITIIVITFIIFVRLYSGSYPIPQNIVGSIVFLAISCISQFSLMYMITALIDKASSYTSIAMLIYLAQMFTGGLTFPLIMFPKTVQNILYLFNPMVSISTGLQNIWISGESIFLQSTNLIYILISTIIFIFVGSLIHKLKHKAQTVKAY